MRVCVEYVVLPKAFISPRFTIATQIQPCNAIYSCDEAPKSQIAKGQLNYPAMEEDFNM